MRQSIMARLVLMYAASALVIFSLIGAVLYAVVKSELLRHERDGLVTTFNDIEYMVTRTGTRERWERVRAKLDTLTPVDGKVRFWIFSDDPNFSYGKDLADLHDIELDSNNLGQLHIKGQTFALHTLAKVLPAYLDRPAIRLIVGVNTEPYFETLHTFVAAMLGLSLAGMLLVVLFGYWIARTGLQPLKKMSDKAQTLSPKTLAERLTVAALPAELSDLAQAFNGALDRMGNAYQQLEAFNADVAHELRTPLANLIGETQVALSRERSAAEFETVLQSNLEELDRLRSIINDMLFLARCDQGEAATSLVHAIIADEVQKTIEFFEFVLDEMNMSVTVNGDIHASTRIETALFRRALTNLLQNAIQHSPNGARIGIAIDAKEHEVQVTITNPGAPIAPHHLPRLFDRFYRVDSARRDFNGIHGHGLGLAIVQAIARMHGGRAFAASCDKLTTIGFTVEKRSE